jgi:hypothetical protein
MLLWNIERLLVLNNQYPGALCVPTTLKPIDIIHLDNTAPPIWPMYVAERPLESPAYLINNLIHLQTASDAQTLQTPPDAIGLRGEFIEIPTRLASYHYHSWPGADKAHALCLLQYIR